MWVNFLRYWRNNFCLKQYDVTHVCYFVTALVTFIETIFGLTQSQKLTVDIFECIGDITYIHGLWYVMVTQQAITCSKLRIETLKKGVKYVQS